MIVGFYAFTPYKDFHNPDLGMSKEEAIELVNNSRKAQEERKKAGRAKDNEIEPEGKVDEPVADTAGGANNKGARKK